MSYSGGHLGFLISIKNTHFCVQRTHKQLTFLWKTMVFTSKAFMLHKAFTGWGSEKSRLLLKILNMCDGCMNRRMDVHTDRRMSGRTDEITCNSILPNHTRVTWKQELYFSYVLRGLLIIENLLKSNEL
jgi:hypothetical protein